MTYVVTQHCIDCKYTECAAVCPVDAFHQGERMLYINPDTCVDCDACVPACPVEAIYADEILPAQYQSYLGMNAEQSRVHPIINKKQDPLPTAKKLEELKELDAKGWSPPGFPPPLKDAGAKAA